MKLWWLTMCLTMPVLFAGLRPGLLPLWPGLLASALAIAAPVRVVVVTKREYRQEHRRAGER